MGTINNGKRLIPFGLRKLRHRGMVRKKTTVYDYAARKVFMEVEKKARKAGRKRKFRWGPSTTTR